MRQNKTITTYNKTHDLYDKAVEKFWQEFPQSTINEFAKKLEGKKVLNIGSGTGKDAVLLREKELDILCIDASAKMILKTKGLGFKSILMDMRNMSFKNNTFDGIWAYTSLLHITKGDMIKVLYTIHNILKQNGVLLIGMIEGTFEGIINSRHLNNATRYFQYYEETELKEIVENIGFTLEHQDRYKQGEKSYLHQIYKKVLIGDSGK